MSEIKPIKKRGGFRPGSGRKSMAVEDNVRGAIKKAMKDDPKQLSRIWKTVFERAEKGSDRHIQILFQYVYGKPIENVQVLSKQMIISREIVHIDGK